MLGIHRGLNGKVLLIKSKMYFQSLLQGWILFSKRRNSGNCKKHKRKENVLVNGFLPLDEGNLDTLKNDLVKSLTHLQHRQHRLQHYFLKLYLIKMYGKKLGKCLSKNQKRTLMKQLLN